MFEPRVVHREDIARMDVVVKRLLDAPWRSTSGGIDMADVMVWPALILGLFGFVFGLIAWAKVSEMEKHIERRKPPE